jgi:hypothetical protein
VARTSEANWTDDERLASDFLTGRIIDGASSWSHQYLEPGTAEEREARAALVRLLRSDAPLNDWIRRRLAVLFDYDFEHGGGPDHFLHVLRLETRMLVFKNRSSGAQPQPARDFTLAEYVARKMADGIKVESAIQEAMDHFGVERPTAFRAYREHSEPIILRLYVEGRFHGELPKHVRDTLEAMRARRDAVESPDSDSLE